MKGIDFIFHCTHLLCCKCHETTFKCDGSYISSLDWIKNKKAAINSSNKEDNKCFQYAATVALNHEEIKKDLQRISKSKPFINKYN